MPKKTLMDFLQVLNEMYQKYCSSGQSITSNSFFLDSEHSERTFTEWDWANPKDWVTEALKQVIAKILCGQDPSFLCWKPNSNVPQENIH